jgi:LysR family transcriptional activator of nhaA
MSMPAIAGTLKRGFPRSLDGVPLLLPTEDTAIRRAIDQWLARLDIHALVVGEFEDYAMLREFAHAGHGLIPVPALQVDQLQEVSGLVPIGTVDEVTVQFHAITVDRKIQHPAVATIVQNARQTLAAQPSSRRARGRRKTRQ